MNSVAFDHLHLDKVTEVKSQPGWLSQTIPICIAYSRIQQFETMFNVIRAFFSL